MQLPGSVHMHLVSPKSSLAGHVLQSGRARQTPVQNTLWTHSLRPSSSGARKGWVLDAVPKTLPSPADKQIIPNQAVELSLRDSRAPGGETEQLQGQWRGLCAALGKSAAT